MHLVTSEPQIIRTVIVDANVVQPGRTVTHDTFVMTGVIATSDTNLFKIGRSSSKRNMSDGSVLFDTEIRGSAKKRWLWNRS